MKYHRLIGLNNRHFILRNSRAGKPKIKVTMYLFFWLAVAAFLFSCPHMAFPQYTMMGVTPSRLNLNWMISQKVYLQILSHGSSSFNTWIWGEHKLLVHEIQWDENLPLPLVSSSLADFGFDLFCCFINCHSTTCRLKLQAIAIKSGKRYAFTKVNTSCSLIRMKQTDKHIQDLKINTAISITFSLVFFPLVNLENTHNQKLNK